MASPVVESGSPAAGDLSTPQAIDVFVRANTGWNFGVNLLDISFMMLGMSLVSRETVMPVLVSSLTDSKLAVGLIGATVGLGFYLPQLLTAEYTERLRYKKPFVVTLGYLGERLPYLLIAVTIWLWALRAPLAALTLFFIFLGMTTFSAGAANPAWYDMIAKVIPVHRRGLWSGLGHSLGAGMGIAGAALVGWTLKHFAYPANYVVLFGLAFVMVTISWVGLALNREPPSLLTKEPTPFMRYLRRLPAVLHDNPNYRAFLIARMTVQAGAMASVFFIVYGRERFVIDATGIGALTAVLIGSQAVMNLVWGLWGDRSGHKRVLTAAAFALALASLAALLAPSVAWLAVTFFLLGAYLAADSASGLNIILEFCAPEDRPTYIGLTNTLFAPVIVVAPLIGGWLASVMDYRGMMVIAMIIAALGALQLLLGVEEPRRAGRHQIS